MGEEEIRYELAKLGTRVATINRNMVYVLSAVVQSYSALGSLAREVGVTKDTAEEIRVLSARIDEAVKKMSEDDNG